MEMVDRTENVILLEIYVELGKLWILFLSSFQFSDKCQEASFPHIFEQQSEA